MKKHHVADSSHRKAERGSVLAYTVLSVLFLFFAVGLGADLSHLYMVKNELQNSADAAALAGASALLLPEEVRISTAVDRAVEIMNRNKYNFNNLSLDVDRDDLCGTGQACVEFAVNLGGPYMNEAAAAGTDNIRFVSVRTPSEPVNIFFSIPILGLSRDLEAYATSGLSVASNVFCNFVPIAVVEGAFGGGLGWLDADGNGTKDYATDCNPPAGSPTCDPTTKFCPGCKYKMVAGPSNFQDTSAGNYQALDAGDGAHDLKHAIAGGTTNCLTSNDNAEFITETEPGRMTGPISKGLNTRFDIYKSNDCPPGATCSNFGGQNVTINGQTKPVSEAYPPDKNIYAGPEPPTGGKGGGPPESWVYAGIWYHQYQSAVDPHPATSGPNWKSPSHLTGPWRREILMPIINKDQFGPGKTTVMFSKVGKFFMNKFVDEGNNEIYVEYLEPALGAGGFDPDGGNVAPVVVPVLYK